ncbi:MAG: DUF4433 domain-containing protein [Leadbetterella sp.]|nr:DUF4433 domain-containing protein [Leadbetterella sp.]
MTNNGDIQYLTDITNKYPTINLCYIASIDNAESIIENGILSYADVKHNNIKHKSTANPDVQGRRERKFCMCSGGLQHIVHDLVPLYFTTKTPTSFRMIRESDPGEYFFIIVKWDILFDANSSFIFTDGNAACGDTRFFCDLKHLSKIPWAFLSENGRAYHHDKEIRQRNAELLIYPKIDNKYFAKVVAHDLAGGEKLTKLKDRYNLNVEIIVDKDGEFFDV